MKSLGQAKRDHAFQKGSRSGGGCLWSLSQPQKNVQMMTNPPPCRVLLTLTTHRSVAFARGTRLIKEKASLPPQSILGSRSSSGPYQCNDQPLTFHQTFLPSYIFFHCSYLMMKHGLQQTSAPIPLESDVCPALTVQQHGNVRPTLVPAGR